MRMGLSSVFLVGSLMINGGALAEPFQDARAANASADYATALKIYRQLAEQGDVRAQLALVRLYVSGKDYVTALVWLRKAADQGNTFAQIGVGQMLLSKWQWHDYGGFLAYDLTNVPTDRAEAVRWFRNAADRGDPEAQCLLATVYALGQGVPQDFTTARMWLRKAAAGGNASAEFSARGDVHSRQNCAKGQCPCVHVV